MKEKVDNIYIYLWEEFNTIYVGRTKNPKSRHYQHKHRESEKTYKFSSEHHVEHPKMIIIENDLTVEEGAEREKYWISYYKEKTPYNILNKTIGGEIGRGLILTEEERNKHKKEYYQKNKEELRNKSKKYRESHEENEKIRSRKYYELHKEELKEKNRKYSAEYYNANKEKVKKRINEYNNANKETLSLKKKEYYRNNKEVINAKSRLYKKSHKEEIKAYKRKYYELHKEEIKKKRKEYPNIGDA